MSDVGSWRLRVSHETSFDYEGLARASYNELRLTPRTEQRQTALESRVATSPLAPQFAYVDYWGSHVIAFNVDRGHERLSITSASLVDTKSATAPTDWSWDDLAAAASTKADHLSHNRYTEPGAELRSIADELRARTPLLTAQRIIEWTQGALCYSRGVTSVHTSANEAYVDGAGVCQDFAHLALSLAKTVGVPSRYVSGYFHPELDATIGEEVVGETHAWIELWTGSWWGYDPTNDCEVGNRHVAVARGRDYADVPPVKGIYAGNAEHSMRVRVRITRTN